MRVMEIPPFPRRLENPDLENLFEARLSQAIVLWPEQAISLVGCMGWPNDVAARDEGLRILRSWPEDSKTVPARLRRIQYEWLRSEERRVGKEWRYRWARDHREKKERE